MEFQFSLPGSCGVEALYSLVHPPIVGLLACQAAGPPSAEGHPFHLRQRLGWIVRVNFVPVWIHGPFLSVNWLHICNPSFRTKVDYTDCHLRLPISTLSTSKVHSQKSSCLSHAWRGVILSPASDLHLLFLVSTHTHTHARMCVCVCVYIYLVTCVCMRTHMHTHLIHNVLRGTQWFYWMHLCF